MNQKQFETYRCAKKQQLQSDHFEEDVKQIVNKIIKWNIDAKKTFDPMWSKDRPNGALPLDYFEELIVYISSLLSQQRTQTIEEIKKKVGNGWYGKSSNGMVDIHVIGISTLYEILDSLK